MNGPIRLLVSDIDGTLVRADKTLPDANRDAVRALIADGVAVTLISARPPTGMLWLAKTLGIAGPMSAFNGGTMLDGEGRILFAHRLEPADAATMLQLLERRGVTVWTFADGRWFTTKRGEPHEAHERLASGLEPEMRTEFAPIFGNIDKIVGVSDDSALLQQLETDARAAIGSRATIARSQPFYLDITHRLANKGDGIASLAEAAGVDLAQVAALGDMPNDLPMFARAGLSIAMGQVPAEVQAAATATAATNEQDGVADAIARFVRPRASLNEGPARGTLPRG